MRPAEALLIERIYIISIHASVKDATLGYLMCYNVIVISIHASVKDATKAKAV